MSIESIGYLIIAAIVYGPHLDGKRAAGVAFGFVLICIARELGGVIFSA